MSPTHHSDSLCVCRRHLIIELYHNLVAALILLLFVFWVTGFHKLDKFWKLDDSHGFNREKNTKWKTVHTILLKDALNHHGYTWSVDSADFLVSL